MECLSLTELARQNQKFICHEINNQIITYQMQPSAEDPTYIRCRSAKLRCKNGLFLCWCLLLVVRDLFNIMETLANLLKSIQTVHQELAVVN